MNVIIVDIETTGIDPIKDRMLEIAIIDFSVKHGSIVSQHSELFWHEDLVNAAEDVNGISSELINDDIAIKRMKGNLTDWSNDPHFSAIELGHPLLAHCAEFESSWLGADRNWVCTKQDWEWPRGRLGSSLVELAIAHRVPVPYAHRALDDCRLLAEVLRTYKPAEVEAMLIEAMKPRRNFIANVSYEDRELAKKNGFNWDPAKRIWVRRLGVDKQLAGGYGFPFPVSPLF